MEKSTKKCKCGKPIDKDYNYCQEHCIHNTESLDWNDTGDELWCRHCGATESRDL